MSYGFFARGKQGNLVIDDTNPVLSQLQGGDIRVTHRVPETYGGYYSRPHWAVCNVVYSQPIRTQAPPFVFAVPSAAGNPGGGVGMFCHVGGPGLWTGFRVVFIASLRFNYLGDGGAIDNYLYAGVHTGWEYRVCGFDAPRSNDEWGMRIWAADGRLVFDSGWKLTPFRQLLTGWTLESVLKNPAMACYMGDSIANPQKDLDAIAHIYRHPWGARDGELGILLSALNMMQVDADLGWSGDRGKLTVAPFVGFHTSDRAYLRLGISLGVLQHSGTNAPALNGWGLMTADFSRT